MKAFRKLLVVIVVLSLFSSPLVAATDTEIRKELIETSRKELLSLAQNEVNPGTLGEWKEIIDSSLYILFRRTELFRGKMHVLVIDNPSIIVKLYPEGTFVLSTGLLDYIDGELFENAASSTRKMRNFDSEREAILFPFLVPEAAHFALDHSFIAFKRNYGSSFSFQPSKNEVLEADRFSLILLKLAEFDESILDAWFVTLSKIYQKDALTGVFSSYLTALPSPEIRANSIADSRENILKIAAEFSSVLASIRTSTAFDEARGSIAALREIYPVSNYISRLEAIILHRQWLTTRSASEQELKTFFPVADEDDPSRASFVSLLDKAQPAFPSPTKLELQATIPGNKNIYIDAVAAYKNVVDTYADPSLSSSYALLLLFSGNTDIRKTAVQTAEKAAIEEMGSTCITARANYASILYFTGTDYVKAQYMLETMSPSVKKTDSEKKIFAVDQGYPGDERDILLNSALLLRALGDQQKALEKKIILESLLKKERKMGTISLRFVRAGDSVDTLVEKWGRPSEILYNYYTENWEYPSLSASVLVIPESLKSDILKVSLIRFGPSSPVSLGGDIRTGDKRNDFETIFGKPLYRAGDCEIYIKDGNRIAVLYLGDTIRNITVGL